MATVQIREALEQSRHSNKNVILMHCVAKYPHPSNQQPAIY